ncbi:MAG: hypothetical protein ACXAEU_19640 [Candidatus Hodarchaeales archaeon]|jgi:hypothetical protein
MVLRNSHSDEDDQFSIIPPDHVKQLVDAITRDSTHIKEFLSDFDYILDPYEQGLSQPSFIYSSHSFLRLSRNVLKYINPERNNKGYVLIHGFSGVGKTTWARFYLPDIIRQVSKNLSVFSNVMGKYYDLVAENIKDRGKINSLVAKISGDISKHELTYIVLDNAATLYHLPADNSDDELKGYDFLLPDLIKRIEKEIDSDLSIICLLDSVSYDWLRNNEYTNIKVENYISTFREENFLYSCKLDRMVDDDGNSEIIPLLKYRIKAAGGSCSRFEPAVFERIAKLSLNNPAFALDIAGDVARKCYNHSRERKKQKLNVTTSHLEEIANYTFYAKLTMQKDSSIITEDIEDLRSLFNDKKRAIFKAMFNVLGKRRLIATYSLREFNPSLVNSTAKSVFERVTGKNINANVITYHLKDLSINCKESSWPFFRKEGSGKGTKYTIDSRMIHHFEYLIERLIQLDERPEVEYVKIEDL